MLRDSAIRFGTASRLRRSIHALLGATALSLCAGTASAAPGNVEITWTEHGIPHVRASNFYDLGYGYGYASAKNDVCGLTDIFASFSGTRSEVFGADKADVNRIVGRRPLANPANDAVRRLLIDDARVKKAKAALTVEARQLVDGYAAGINRYIDETSGSALPEACRYDGSVRHVSGDDVVRRAIGFTLLLGSGVLLQEIYDAAPPTEKRADLTAPASEPMPTAAGSNAYGFGRETTGGPGLLLANPHFFWDGPDRQVEAHLTIPGSYDVMGSSIHGLPMILIGFNKTLAWSHTVSTDKRGTIYQLTLDPADPTRYMVDGKSVPMTRREVTFKSRDADGTVRTASHTFWLTRWGPVLHSKELPWTKETAFAFADANAETPTLIPQFLAMGRSKDVASLKTSLVKGYALPWVNTIAADADGKAFYADISIAPSLDRAALTACQSPKSISMARYYVLLDGTKSACGWKVMPASAKPSLTRDDWVENSNNSYWMANPNAPLTGFSPIIGDENTVLNMRARQGHQQVLDRLAGKDGLPGNRMTPQALQAILFSGRSLHGELVVDDLVRACRGEPDLAKACDALAGWNRRYDLDSKGAVLFSFFSRQLKPTAEDLSSMSDLWKVKFDPAQPLTTPRDFNGDAPGVIEALKKAVAMMDTLQLPLDAKLGDVQFVVRNGERIPLHGGATFSVVGATPVKGVGLTDPITFANSYIATVTFDADGPVADAILASSQTPDPASPFYADQTKLYSQKVWVRLPYTQAQIAAKTIDKKVLDTRAH